MVHFAVGCYTHHRSPDFDARGRGITLLRWSGAADAPEVVSEYAEIRNPTYLAWDSAARRLHAVCGTGADRGGIASFAVGPDLKMDSLGIQEGPAGSACHLTVLPSRRRLYATSYHDGHLSGFSLEDGAVGPPVYDFAYDGRGPNPERQASPHAHQVTASPYGSLLYVCDLGTDTIWMHSLDAMDRPPAPALRLPPGYGPRHLAFDPVAPAVFVLCELVPKLLTAGIDTATGRLNITGEYDTTAPGRAAVAAPAAVKIHPSGRTVAVSNRFDDSIAVFRIHRPDSLRSGRPAVFSLELADRFSSDGRTPRDIEFTSDGGALFIANQDSHSISCRIFDPVTGIPDGRRGPALETGSPVCVLMLD